MNIKFNKKYISIGIISFLVIALAIIFFFAMFQIKAVSGFFRQLNSILTPILWGLIIAYLLTPVLNFIERRLFFPLWLKKKGDVSAKGKRVIRVISIVLTMFVLIMLITIFARTVIPQISTSISRITVQFPYYMEALQNWAKELKFNDISLFQYVDSLLDTYSKDIYGYFNNTVWPQLQDHLKNASIVVLGVFKGLWNFVIGAIISIYVLLNKELFAAQGKKLLYAFLPIGRVNFLLKDLRFVSDTFIGFLSGKIVDSFIIGIICFICCTIMNMPYAMLLSLIIGLTNIIPFFGPFIGAIPTAFLVLMVDPVKCLYFLIFIVILQQVDGNIIGPKILGDSTGLSGFWVIFSITVFGGLWGVLGMIIGIPVFAVFYAMLKRAIERKLVKKNMPVESWDYAYIKRIEDDGSILELYEADVHNFEWKKKEGSENKISKLLSKKKETDDNVESKDDSEE